MQYKEKLFENMMYTLIVYKDTINSEMCITDVYKIHLISCGNLSNRQPSLKSYSDDTMIYLMLPTHLIPVQGVRLELSNGSSILL